MKMTKEQEETRCLETGEGRGGPPGRGGGRKPGGVVVSDHLNGAGGIMVRQSRPWEFGGP